MSASTTIEWATHVWNPTTGCDMVSPGCGLPRPGSADAETGQTGGCYAMGMARRLKGMGQPKYQKDGDSRTSGPGFGLTTHPGTLTEPLRWRKPRRVFVNSMSDLFHDKVPDEFIARVFAVMALTPQHTYQILTKRHARMRSLLSSATFWHQVAKEGRRDLIGSQQDWLAVGAMLGGKPLPNVWLGVSIEDQKRAELRIPALLDTPAAIRFLSCEPLLAPVDLERAVWTRGSERGHGLTMSFVHAGDCCRRFHGIDWVIAGGESGPGARPMHPDWARSLRDQCVAAEVPFFFKQWGEHVTATVRDDARFAGGRVFDDPRGGKCAPVVREPGPSGTFRNATSRLLRPGENAGALTLLDPDTIAVRVGKKTAGRELDGQIWDEYPPTRDLPAGPTPDGKDQP